VRLVLRQRIRDLSPRGEFILVWMVCFGYFTASSGAALLLGRHQFERDTNQILRGIAIELAILGAFAAIVRLRGWTGEGLGLRFTWPAALAGIPLYVAFMAVYAITAATVTHFLPLANMQFRVHAPLGIVVVFIVVNSLYEELTVTGYVISALSHDGAALAITASTLIRFAYHLYQGPLASISILPLGLLFGAVYWRWRTLWPLMVAHTLTNVISFASQMR
jgi:membrane protease YdiL (CAAX protease family)